MDRIALQARVDALSEAIDIIEANRNVPRCVYDKIYDLFEAAEGELKQDIEHG